MTSAEDRHDCVGEASNCLIKKVGGKVCVANTSVLPADLAAPSLMAASASRTMRHRLRSVPETLLQKFPNYILAIVYVLLNPRTELDATRTNTN